MSGLETTVRWIDVADAYPDADLSVLVAIVDDAEPVWIGWCDGSEWFDAGTGAQIAGRVTHWCELPMSPNPPALRKAA